MIDNQARRQFDHERFEVYQKGLDFVEFTERIAKKLAPGRSHIVDQWRRAALSIVLNTAEGAGEYQPREKVRFYRIAARSATECAAILDVVARLEPGVRVKELQDGRDCLLNIVSMLVGLAKATERKTEGQRQRNKVKARLTETVLAFAVAFTFTLPLDVKTPAAQRATGVFPQTPTFS